MIDLGVRGDARRINERGEVAGYSSSVVTPEEARVLRVFLWRAGRILLSTPMVGYEINLYVAGMDERGRIVGQLEGPLTPTRTLAWVAH